MTSPFLIALLIGVRIDSKCLDNQYRISGFQEISFRMNNKSVPFNYKQLGRKIVDLG